MGPIPPIQLGTDSSDSARVGGVERPPHRHSVDPAPVGDVDRAVPHEVVRKVCGGYAPEPADPREQPLPIRPGRCGVSLERPTTPGIPSRIVEAQAPSPREHAGRPELPLLRGQDRICRDPVAEGRLGIPARERTRSHCVGDSGDGRAESVASEQDRHVPRRMTPTQPKSSPARRTRQSAGPLFRMRESYGRDLDPAGERFAVVIIQSAEQSVAPAEGRARMNADPCSRRAHAQPVAEAGSKCRPEFQLLRVSRRCAGEVAEGAPAATAAVALPSREPAPAVYRFERPAVGAAEAVGEASRAQSGNDRFQRRLRRMRSGIDG